MMSGPRSKARAWVGKHLEVFPSQPRSIVWKAFCGAVNVCRLSDVVLRRVEVTRPADEDDEKTLFIQYAWERCTIFSVL